jgi:hypothetical protein
MRTQNFFALGIFLLAAGCCTDKHGYVAKEWSRMMREEQVTPVFPPREDFRVGDVFLSTRNPTNDPNLVEAKGYVPVPLLLDWVSVNQPLLEKYKLRGEFPRTPTNHLERAGTNGEMQIVPGEFEAVSDKVFGEDTMPDRLRHVGFPEFSFAKVNKASVQAVIPVEGLNLLLGANWAKATEGALKISSGESYSLPAAVLDPFVRTQLLVTNTTHFKPAYKNLLIPAINSSPEKKVWLTVVTEVFFARTLDVSFSLKNAFGGSLGANPTLPSAGQGLDLATNALAIAGALEKLNIELLKQSQPGGSVSVVHASTRAIGLRRTYIRPVAVGFRGYVIEVSLKGEEPEIGGVYIDTGTSPRVLKEGESK